MVLGTAAAAFPDTDVVLSYLSPLAYLYHHRGVTHSVLLAPLFRQVEIRVADTGIGIPPAERAKVFDAFYQVDSSSTREYGGTGLGLSIVKRIVDAHGGQVRVLGNEPNGTVFVVTLPSAQARRAALPSRVPPAVS